MDSGWLRVARGSLPRAPGGVETRWMGWQARFLNGFNAGKRGAVFISVYLETRWLGHKRGFYVPEILLQHPCMRTF